MEEMRNLYKSHPTAIVESKTIGKGTCIWAFAHVMKGAVIGKDCNICDHCYIEGKSYIGNRVTIKNSVSIWEGLKIEDDVFIGPDATFTNDLFPISRVNKRRNFKDTIIKRGACIGANVTVVCNITIGCYAFVGAGSVVTRDLPDYVLAYGNPAQIHGYLCKCRDKLKFTNKIAKCRCGLRYKKNLEGYIKLAINRKKSKLKYK